jgi:uncharacterized protein (TIGR03382 family)
MFRFMLSLACGLAASTALTAPAAQTLHVGIENGRLERYDLSGNSLGGFPIRAPYNIAVDSQGFTYVAQIFVLDGPIVKYDATGHLVQLIELPQSNNSFTDGLEVDKQDRLYVGINGPKDAIYRYSSAGDFLDTFATLSVGAPFEIAFDAFENLYVTADQHVRKFAPTGASLSRISIYPPATSFALDLAFNSLGNLYVATQNEVVAFDEMGNYLATVARVPNPNALFTCIAFDKNDVLYVAGHASAGNFIDKYTRDGAPLGSFLSGLPRVPTDMVFTTAIPEPAAVSMTLFGLAFAALVRRRVLTADSERTYRGNQPPTG